MYGHSGCNPPVAPAATTQSRSDLALQLVRLPLHSLFWLQDEMRRTTSWCIAPELQPALQGDQTALNPSADLVG